jgi:hypothetical protein
MGIVGIHPAVFRKSAEELDGKGVVKHSLVKERKERRKRVVEVKIWDLAGMKFSVHGRG